MEICPHDKCTGCYACVNVCPHGCISMEEDTLGAVHPVVNENKCVHCSLCIKTCPNNASLEFKYPIKCYASWITDSEKRKKCASGGIGTVMSEFVIKQGGVVFGSRYDENLTPVMTYAEKLDELEYFKGSRYVQSLVGSDTFKHVRSFLNEDRLVLFIGTPCQIAGLKMFLRKDYDNLITVDLICHGVCPTKYLKEEVAYLSNKYGFKDISDIRFRGNDGNDFRLTLWNKYGKKLFPSNKYREKIFLTQDIQQYYINGFILGISLRNNCYICNYAKPERISDISIGDFIGLGKMIPFDFSTRNVSSVIINTTKGNAFYRDLSDEMRYLKNVLRTYEERLEYKPSLLHPFLRHPMSGKFEKEYIKFGYAFAIRETLRRYLLKRRFGLLFKFSFYRMPHKLLSIFHLESR